ncbi:hypothetical protein G9A89_011975 [Geosiphon pyriformis]|nr:hypothetical protein G9A89_011975 [Geosiphon pyriformis]
MPMNNVYLLCRNIDILNIVCSKLLYQITYRNKKRAGKPKPVHKCSNLLKTEPIDTFKATILDDNNILSKAIFKFRFNITAADMTEGKTQGQGTKDTNLTKLNFFKIPETWSAKSFKEHSKDTK